MNASFRARALRRALLSSLMIAASLGVGCGDPEPDPEPPPVDAGIDSGPVDAGRPCLEDAECDDGVACTRDNCRMGFCINAPDFGACDDGIFCNGNELCDARMGCVSSPRQTCNDGDVCSIDRCDEESRSCVRRPRDLDQDGDVDFFCEGGGDCDDRDPTRSSFASEVCDDDVDNDCDGVVDESECGGPANDTCEDPLDVSAGGIFEVDLSGATANYVVACAGAARPDKVLTFTLTEPRDVLLSADASFSSTGLSLRSACGDEGTEFSCASGYGSVAGARNLPAGTYFATVNTQFPSSVDVDVRFREPSEPPAHETCATALDISAGGRFEGSFLGVADDLQTACGVSAAPDLVHELTLTEPRDVRISAISDSGLSLTWELRETCADDESAQRCAYGAPAGGLLHELPAGTYFLVLEGPSRSPVDYVLQVDLLPPTPALPGDRCDGAIPLTLGAAFMGSLAGMEDDLYTSCGYAYVDAVHEFTLTERQDVMVEVSGGASLSMSVRGACDAGDSQKRCATGATSAQRVRDLAPGTYTVIVESRMATTYSLTVTALPPTPVLAASGNDTCATAFEVPATGGYFTGTTVGFANDLRTAACGMAQGPDAAFRLELPVTSRVIASTDGSSYDTVLHLHSAMCTTGAELACDDDSGEGTTSMLDRTLAAGVYYLVVDGWSSTSAGPYALDVTVSPSP